MLVKNNYEVLGLMSGTSLDGLDLAYCSFRYAQNRWHFELLAGKSIDYSEQWQNRLKNAIHASALELLELDIDFGQLMGNAVREFLNTLNRVPDFVSRHGHTVFHQPHKRITLQIGSGQELANVCGQTVVYDFRTKDVLLGGQGAPLVPIGDQELFYDYDFCLNLGGISNVSFQRANQRIAYDIGPANMLLNYLANQLNLAYDDKGQIAASGKLDQPLYDALNALPYYQQTPPKSLGYEWFQEQVRPIIDSSSASTQDKLNTGVQHICKILAKDLLQHNHSAKARLLITGGGAKNDFLIQTLKTLLDGKMDLVIPDPMIIDYKEALVFAFMGVKRMRMEANCLQSVTGAIKDVSGGKIAYP